MFCICLLLSVGIFKTFSLYYVPQSKQNLFHIKVIKISHEKSQVHSASFICFLFCKVAFGKFVLYSLYLNPDFPLDCRVCYDLVQLMGFQIFT